MYPLHFLQREEKKADEDGKSEATSYQSPKFYFLSKSKLEN